jgi:aspartate/tyrosine/aromatic aminotransferase
MSVFSAVPLAPANPILGLAQDCQEDTFPDKINMTLGAYRSEEGSPVVLPSVRAAEGKIMDSNMNHEYLKQDGLADFTSACQVLMFGEGASVLAKKQIFTIQSISGTGAIRLGLSLMKDFMPNIEGIYLPEVTWGNHPAMVKDVGLALNTYRYLDEAGTGLNFAGMLEDIKNIPEGHAVLLHAVAHNPTGVDPTNEDWQDLLKVVQEKKLFVMFDSAYQGFVSGNPNVDAYAVRLFADAGVEMLVAVSFSKNFGLYGERTGCLHVVSSDDACLKSCASQLRAISRVLYSTCPSFGARIVSTILNDPASKAQWEADCKGMADRLNEVRQLLHTQLGEADVKGTWDHVIKQRGMFSYTGLSKDTVARLRSEYHIYMLTDGRISLAGLNKGNTGRFVQALKEILGTN